MDPPNVNPEFLKFLVEWDLKNPPIQPSKDPPGGPPRSPLHRSPSSNPSAHPPDPKHRFCYWVVLAILTAVAFAFGFSQINMSAINSDNLIVQFDCSQIHSHDGFLNQFPLPYTINTTLHGVALHEVGYEKTLSSLIVARANVCSSLKLSGQELTKLSTRASNAFNHDILVAFRQLGSTTSEVSVLMNLYDSVRQAYYKLNTTAAEAVKKVELTHQRDFLISLQPYLWGKAGLNAKRAYWEPWKEKTAKAEEIRLGLIALEREILRLEQIKRVLQEADRSLQQLATTDTESATGLADNDNMFRTSILKFRKVFLKQEQVEGSQSRREWLEKTFRQHILENRQLLESWNELLASVSEGDETLGHVGFSS